MGPQRWCCRVRSAALPPATRPGRARHPLIRHEPSNLASAPEPGRSKAMMPGDPRVGRLAKDWGMSSSARDSCARAHRGCGVEGGCLGPLPRKVGAFKPVQAKGAVSSLDALPSAAQRKLKLRLAEKCRLVRATCSPTNVQQNLKLILGEGRGSSAGAGFYISRSRGGRASPGAGRDWRHPRAPNPLPSRRRTKTTMRSRHSPAGTNNRAGTKGPATDLDQGRVVGRDVDHLRVAGLDDDRPGL